MSSPKLDSPKEEKFAPDDPVTAWLNQTEGQTDGGRKATESQALPARVCAELAINQFQNLIFDLTYDQARDAYMRLLIGRGFNQARSPTEILPKVQPPTAAQAVVQTKKKEAS